MSKSRVEHIQDMEIMSTWLRGRPRSEVEVLLAGDQGYDTISILTMTDDEMRHLATVLQNAASFLRNKG